MEATAPSFVDRNGFIPFGDDQIVHAIEAHHNDVEPSSVLAVLVQAADAVSAARPAAPQGDIGSLREAPQRKLENRQLVQGRGYVRQ